VEFLGEFFYGVWYWYTSIKSKKNYKFEVSNEIVLKNCGLLHFLIKNA
jgi:hypothetical protein